MTTAKTFVWTFALCLAGSGALVLAQNGNKAAPPTSTCEHCEQCPMKVASELSDIKVELTKNGALIRLTAKRAEDVTKVQESAQEVAAALSGGGCVMHMGHGGMHEHEHNHGEHSHGGAGAK